MGRALLLRARRSDFRLSRPRPPGIPQRELAPDGEEMAQVMEPQEIEDAEHEQILERVAAVDVGKAAGMVCTRVRHDARPGKRRTRVREVSAATGAVLELADHLVAEGIERVSLESTSDYWRIWFYVFEAAGLNVQLVNAHDVKNAPGRPKTDKLDAVWLAKLAERGMVRPSFIPPRPQRQLRDLTRYRRTLTQERTREKQRAEKLPGDAQIKLSSVISDIFGASGRAMLDALIAGRRNPHALAALAYKNMRAKTSVLQEALTGHFTD